MSPSLNPPTSRAFVALPTTVLLLAAILAMAAVATRPAIASPAVAAVVDAGPTGVVSDVPSSATPQVLDGSVKAVAQVGGTMIAGGNFSSVAPPGGGAATPRARVFAFDAGTGAISTGFHPVLDGDVAAVVPGPVAGTVLVGGEFNTVDGVAAKSIVLLRVADGSIDTSFSSPATNGVVNALQVVPGTGRLYAGGTFTKINSQAHGGLVSLNFASGAVDPQVSTEVTINHNWTPASPAGDARSPVAVQRIANTGDGTLVLIGNFKKVDGLDRDQIVELDISGPTAVVRPDWRTSRMVPTCNPKGHDSYARDVEMSPDGSYFVVVNTGGSTPGSLCDTASRWETASRGQDVQPTWVSNTGSDSLLAAAVTRDAVYVGGHQRWMNNGYVVNGAGPGAVPRPGLAALDPDSGVPLAWNPGRNPRGVGTAVIFPTATGVWVGSDTQYIGNRKYLRPRLAFFPADGGRAPASKTVPRLPGTVWSGTSGAMSSRTFDGNTAGPTLPAAAQIDPTTVRGTTLVGGQLFYGRTDGRFYSRTFDGASYGPELAIDPYNDPVWANVQTGSGGVYRGKVPTFYAEIPQLTSLVFDGRSRLYYTMAGKAGLFWRTFSPDSGIVGWQRIQVAGVTLPQVAGAFLDGGQLYWAAMADGSLTRADFDGQTVTNRVVVSGPAKDGVDWRSQVLFLGPQAG